MALGPVNGEITASQTFLRRSHAQNLKGVRSTAEAARPLVQSTGVAIWLHGLRDLANGAKAACPGKNAFLPGWNKRCASTHSFALCLVWRLDPPACLMNKSRVDCTAIQVYDSTSANTIIVRSGREKFPHQVRFWSAYPFGALVAGCDAQLGAQESLQMEYDYIVVGAGAAGCALASRLAEDASSQVLLIEAGGSDRSIIVDMPAALPFAYGSKRLGWHYQAGPEPHLNGRYIDEKRGRALGGSTTINAMIYNRGNPLDYESWAESGLKEWSYAHCLPYFRRMESFSGGEDEWRGADGPMHIMRCKAEHNLHECFLRSGEQLGLTVTKDHNGYRQEGLHIAQAYIHRGRRWSAARGYLDPAKERDNLHVLTDALVERVIFDGDRAVGVAYQSRRASATVLATREVILCAG